MQETLELMKGLKFDGASCRRRASVGVASLGRLSAETDVGPARADISTAPPDR